MSDPDTLTEQPPREDTRCPECGGVPEPSVTHRLGALRYLHDDQRYTCAECANVWTCGVPIGEFDRDEMAAELWCPSCAGELLAVHRVRIGPDAPRGTVRLDMKCPNRDCHYFTQLDREYDDDKCALVGNPRTAGQTADAEPYGYPDDADTAED